MMNLSRHKINGRAISLFTVDSIIPELILGELHATPNIISAIQVTL